MVAPLGNSGIYPPPGMFPPPFDSAIPGLAVATTPQPVTVADNKPKTYETKKQSEFAKAIAEAGKFLEAHGGNLQDQTFTFEGIQALLASTLLDPKDPSSKIPKIPKEVQKFLPGIDKLLTSVSDHVENNEALQSVAEEPSYVSFGDGKATAYINKDQAGTTQTTHTVDLKNQAVGTSITSTGGETVTAQADINDMTFGGTYNGGEDKMKASGQVDLHEQKLSTSVTSTDGQKMSVGGDLNDRTLQTTYDGGAGKISTGANVDLRKGTAGANLTSADDGTSGNANVRFKGPFQADVGIKRTDTPESGNQDGESTQSGNFYFGQRTGFAVSTSTYGTELVANDDGEMQEKVKEQGGLNAAFIYDQGTGQVEMSGGAKRHAQAGFSAGGTEGTKLNLTLGDKVVGDQLDEVSANVHVKQGLVDVKVKAAGYGAQFKQDGSGVTVGIDSPVGIGGKVNVSRSNDVIADQEVCGQDGAPDMRTVTVSDDNQWGATVKYTDATSGITGSVTVEKTKQQDYGLTLVNQEAVPSLTPLETQKATLLKEKSELEGAEKKAKEALTKLESEYKTVQEHQEKPRLTAEGRAEKLTDLRAQIAAQTQVLADKKAKTPEQQTRISAIAQEVASLDSQIEALADQRLAYAERVNGQVEAYLNTEDPTQGAALAAQLQPGEKVTVHREREIGTGVSGGHKDAGTLSFKNDRTVIQDLSIAGLGDQKVRITVGRSTERDRDLGLELVDGIAQADGTFERDRGQSYTVDIDLSTPEGQATYADIMGSTERMGKKLPDLQNGTGVSVVSHTYDQRQAHERGRALNLGGEITLGRTREADFSSTVDNIGGNYTFSGSVTRSETQDSRKHGAIPKLLGQENRITGGNYRLEECEDNSFTLTLHVKDERVTHKEAKRYGNIYQQATASGQPDLTRATARQGNDRSAMTMDIQLSLKPEDLDTIVNADRSTLVKVAKETPGIGPLEAIKLDRQLAKAERRAREESEEQGMTPEQSDASIKAARSRATLEFVERHGEQALPFLQKVTGGQIAVVEEATSVTRSGYSPDKAISSKRLQTLQTHSAALNKDHQISRAEAKDGRDMHRELAQAEAQIQASITALAHDPLIPDSDRCGADGTTVETKGKASLSAELEARKQEIVAAREALESSGVLQKHTSYNPEDIAPTADLSAMNSRIDAMKSDGIIDKQEAQEARQMRRKLEDSQEDVGLALNELKALPGDHGAAITALEARLAELKQVVDRLVQERMTYAHQ